MKISAIILAAGGSTRMAGKNKLLLPYNNKSIINHVCRTVLNTVLSPVIVVTGFENSLVEEELPREIDIIVNNNDWKRGMASSIYQGISALSRDIQGSMIVLGDMPLITKLTLDLLVGEFKNHEGGKIVYPLYDHSQANPVIFPKKYFQEILSSNGDRGCKKVLKKYPDDAIGIPIESDEVVLDCDTQDDYFLIKSEKS
tara:strand:+ start:624 stop:1220 length:597 start_codon:yes stop_codon:yes gene_type:complete